MTSETTEPLGKWVEQLFKTAFFQSDDQMANQAMDQGFSENLKVRINGSLMDRATYQQAAVRVRGSCQGVLENMEELLVTSAEHQPAGGGSVAHLLRFMMKDWKTGEEKKETAVIISTVDVSEGKRLVTEVTEVNRTWDSA
ncbi:hypothetical protein N7468_007197 [Penicillium chermesinum]|uniref:Uncharacterized protein n=1 Tax=Penicillium chermesinum TaxID=63820 RepID=A0A9W9NTL7_9EURO|nr:uncharacterized protein N7468_007197 [Penicillium chermesinum]KAJ5225972.1 hypothetical protein N7468_007197 [Penicillium chermesinum]KAJ6160827.1 hypothetical protein N7470_004223 [Penicillium chermesinum]